MKIKVSIIVPVYNAEKYICSCVESLVNQTLEQIEIILIDDASTDESLSILRQYEKEYSSKVSVYHLDKNSKQGAARNIGVRYARGEYIMFVDSDDLLDVTACEVLYTKADNVEADIVFCHYEQFTSKTQQFFSHINKLYLGDMTVAKRKALMTTSVVPWAKLIRRQLIVANNIFFPSETYYEDQATTYLYYAYAKKVAVVEIPLYKYRVNEISTTNTRNQTYHFQALDMGVCLLERFKKRDLFETYYEELEYFMIEQVFCLGVINCNARFDELPLDYISRLYRMLLEYFPNYKKNRYYSRYMNQFYRLMLEKYETSMDEFVSFISSECVENVCRNYIYLLEENTDKIKQLTGWLLDKEYNVSLWGAGKYGIDIMEFFEQHGFKFASVFDKNEQLEGQQYGYLRVKTVKSVSDVALIIVPFSAWMDNVKNMVREKSDKVLFFNLEMYVKFELFSTLEDYLE